jgi:hypothetical protein
VLLTNPHSEENKAGISLSPEKTQRLCDPHKVTNPAITGARPKTQVFAL